MERYPQNTASRKINVTVLATYTLVHNCIRLLLESNRQIRATEFAYTASELIQTVSENKPDVVLLYLLDNENENIDLIPTLLKVSPQTRVIILSDPNGSVDQGKALQIGAAGVVGMNQNATILINAIRQVYEGDMWLSQKLISRLLNPSSDPSQRNRKNRNYLKNDELTNREHEVIAMIGLGLKNKEISKKLYISEATVRHHLSSIYSKLHVDDRLNLVIYAYQNGLIQKAKPNNHVKTQSTNTMTNCIPTQPVTFQQFS